MADSSHLDKQYFLDNTVYNCPFCNRNNVPYSIETRFEFDWTEEKKCYGFIATCSYCENESMHLSYESITEYKSGGEYLIKEAIDDIDSKIFYSVPTSFFVLDNRINSTIRGLITEAEGCLKMNFLTGASACMRKAIYELLVLEQIEGEHYEDRIMALKKKHSSVDSDLFDILGHIQDMTSDKVHEQSWDKWESKYLKFIIETLKTVLYDIYVAPAEKSQRSIRIKQMQEDVATNKQSKTGKASKEGVGEVEESTTTSQKRTGDN